MTNHRAAGPSTGSAASGAALAIGGLLLLAGLTAFLLTPGTSDLPQVGPAGPVAIASPGAEPTQDYARALAQARGLDPLGPKLFSSLNLRPPTNGPGLVIVGSSDHALLEKAGLKVGDRLLESDKHPIGASDPPLLQQQFATLDAVEITLERDNRLRQMTVDLTR